MNELMNEGYFHASVCGGGAAEPLLDMGGALLLLRLRFRAVRLRLAHPPGRPLGDCKLLTQHYAVSPCPQYPFDWYRERQIR